MPLFVEEPMKKNVIIVDDHPIVRSAVKVLLEDNGYHVVAESSDGFDALEKIRDLEPDYLLLDIGIGSLDGLSVLQRLSADKSGIKTLIFTSHLASTYAVRCMHAGAQGFINKSANLKEILKGLSALTDGYLYFPKEILTSHRESHNASDAPLRGMTNKEVIVLQLLAKGFKNLEIASQMNLSSKTVSGHKVNILRKLGVRTTIELARIAAELGLV
jgi:two-component system response regulator EvgA